MAKTREINMNNFIIQHIVELVVTGIASFLVILWRRVSNLERQQIENEIARTQQAMTAKDVKEIKDNLQELIGYVKGRNNQDLR